MTTTETRRAVARDDYLPQIDRRRRWPWVLAFGLVLAMLAGAGYVVWKTPMFAVRQVDISGAQGALATTVRQATADEIGTPLISVDTGAVTATIGAIPQVDTVTVAKKWPNTVTITVLARVPVAVTNANGAWWLLDAGGVPYDSSRTKPATLIAIELATPGPHDLATRAALQVVTALPPAVSKLVGHVTAASAYDVTLVLTDGRTVIWGDDSNTAQKATVLPAVLARPGKVFDLSDPTMVTVK